MNKFKEILTIVVMIVLLSTSSVAIVKYGNQIHLPPMAP